MENAKHTPAPWTAEMGIAHNVIVAPGGIACLATIHRDIGDGDKEPDANARLIAASPVLLEALRNAVKWMDFVAAKLGDPDELDCNIKKYGARKWVTQFGTGAGHRAKAARAAIAQAEQD